MTANKRVLYIISISFAVILSLSLFLFPANRWLASALCVIACGLSWYFFKKSGILSINKKEVLLIVSTMGLLYLMAYYLTGISYGYKSENNFTFSYFISFVLPAVILVVSTEIYRVKVLSQEDKIANAFCFVSCVLAEILFYTTTVGFATFNRFMDMAGLVILPTLISNVLYHYLAKRYGYAPNVAYRLILALYTFFVPYSVHLHESLFAFSKLILPLLVWAFIYFLYENRRYYTPKKRAKWKYAVYILLVLICIAFIMLVSCQFRFYAIVIGSESMTGEINKGDVVVCERYDDGVLFEGQVIVFENDGVRVVHRIVDVQHVDGETRYYTKGDANTSKDNGYRTEDQILGIVHFKIPYIGYPTLWVREIF